MDRPFQRVGARSNAHVGREFELIAQRFFALQDIHLQLPHVVDIGIGTERKPHVLLTWAVPLKKSLLSASLIVGLPGTTSPAPS